MDLDNFYRDIDQQLCQGDILSGIPHILLKPPVQVLRQTSGGKLGRNTLEAFEINGENTPPGGFKLYQGEGGNISAFCQIARAIVLSHGCEIDKDSKHRLVALIRPLSNVRESDKQIIRENRKFSFFHLEAYKDLLEESYVDFRRISSIDPQLIRHEEKIISLQERAVKALQSKFFSFLTRRVITEDKLEE